MKTPAAWLLLATVAAAALLSHPSARAEPRRPTSQQPFTSGAMRSEQVLREIAGILRSIDARVARLEATVQRLDASNGDHRAR